MLRAANAVVGQSGHIEPKLEFDGARAGHVDRIRIILNVGAGQQPQDERLARIIQELDRVTTANALTRDGAKSANSAGHLEDRRSGLPHHAVAITMLSRCPSPPASAQ